MNIIRLENVSYDYDAGLPFAAHALKDINLDIEEGSIVGLIGSTGSGKSTLLQQMNGLLRPTAGKVYFRGEDIAGRRSGAGNICAQVGMVFQYPENQLFGEDIVSDVMFGPLNIGCSKKEAWERAAAALKMLGIGEEDFRKSPFELSGGQRRRAAIAGIIAMDPQVLLLDEPMAGLDAQGQKELRDTIMSIRRKRKMTVIWSSHSMDDMACYVQRLLVMHEGRIVRDGTPAQVFEDADYLESIGLGIPQAEAIVRALKAAGADVETDALTIGQAADRIEEACRRARTQKEGA